MPTRRSVLAGAALGTLSLCLGACGDGEEPSEEEATPLPAHEGWRAEAEASLTSAASWLWAKQRRNGAFPSSTYPKLRDGQSLTPFSLLALLQVDPRLHPVSVEKAGQSLVQMIRLSTSQGALGLSNPALDAPCRATAMMLTCLALIQPEGWREAASISSTWLRTQQFRKAGGWEGHAAQGGWGPGDRTQRTPPDSGPVDLGTTRSVLEGLRATSSIASSDLLFEEAADFVGRCQTANGGFVDSPAPGTLNENAGRSFGSATADGLLSWIALGVLGSDPQLRRAHDWLFVNHRVDKNPGLDTGTAEDDGSATRGEYRASSAECFMLVGGPSGWRSQLCQTIAAEQRSDGSFANPNGRRREDDPILATGFAIRALAAALRPERAEGL